MNWRRSGRGKREKETEGLVYRRGIALFYLPESPIQVSLRLRVIRVNPQGLLEMFDCLGKSPLTCQNHAEIVVCFGIVTINF